MDIIEENAYTTVDVELSERSYPIHIGRGIADKLPAWLNARFSQCRHVVLIYDENVRVLAEALAHGMKPMDVRSTLLKIPSGEASKSVGQVEALWQAMLDANTDRGSLVIAVGGGVVGDLAGFAAASFARGLGFVQVPTTLLSQVDSSVGGKTGINLPGAKNIVGAFWQPRLVAIDTTSLKTLPDREYRSGLAEVVKYGMILLPDLLSYLEQNTTTVLQREPQVIEHVVAESCRAKAAVVIEDERETTGRRAILNYGHTFAHALESVSGYGQLLHGEAVAIGMHQAATLAAQMGRIEFSLVERQAALLQGLGLPTHCSGLDPERLWQVMQSDKKVEHGRLRFILPKSIGEVELVANVPRQSILETLRATEQ